jgi:hypothetical protein
MSLGVEDHTVTFAILPHVSSVNSGRLRSLTVINSDVSALSLAAILQETVGAEKPGYVACIGAVSDSPVVWSVWSVEQPDRSF